MNLRSPLGRRTSATTPLWKAGLGLALTGSTLGLVLTGAVFSDQTDIGANSFSTGDVEISTSVTSNLVSFTSPPMVPGDTVGNGVTVTNAGTVEMRYAVTSTTTENVLAGQLDLVVWDEAAEADVDTTCAATAPGTTVYPAGDLGSTLGLSLVGNPARGSHTGDRTLAAGASEQLCFRVSLPLETGNTFEGLSTTATFAFQAEQTANNA